MAVLSPHNVDLGLNF